MRKRSRNRPRSGSHRETHLASLTRFRPITPVQRDVSGDVRTTRDGVRDILLLLSDRRQSQEFTTLFNGIG